MHSNIFQTMQIHFEKSKCKYCTTYIQSDQVVCNNKVKNILTNKLMNILFFKYRPKIF